MVFNKISLLVIFVLLSSTAFSQNKMLKKIHENSPPMLKLLPGYVETHEVGIDTAVGKISKKDGIEILYDIGHMAGDRASGALSQKERVLWFKEQEFNGQNFRIVYFKDGYIFANVNHYANFTSLVKTNEELAVFLMMVMTYGYQNPPKDWK